MANKYDIIEWGLTGLMGAAVLTLAGLGVISLDHLAHRKTTCKLEQTIMQDIDNDGEEEQISVGVCPYNYWVLPDETHFRVYVGNGDSYAWHGYFEQKPSNLRLEDINNDGDLDIRVNAGGSEYALEQVKEPGTDTYFFTEPAEY